MSSDPEIHDSATAQREKWKELAWIHVGLDVKIETGFCWQLFFQLIYSTKHFNTAFLCQVAYGTGMGLSDMNWKGGSV